MLLEAFLLSSLIFHGHARANSAMFSNIVASKHYFCSFRYSVHIPEYTGKYLFRRIYRASNGSYNPFIITNKSKALCATTVFFGSGNELLNTENELLINEDLSNRNAV